MRLSVFLALLVVTFVASCVPLTKAEKAAKIDHTLVRRLKGSRHLAEEWWVTDDEERTLGAKTFVTNLKGKVDARKAAQAAGVVEKAETLNKAQINAIAKSAAAAAKKDRKVWPMIKKGLKFVYGVASATLIITAAIAMYKLYA